MIIETGSQRQYGKTKVMIVRHETIESPYNTYSCDSRDKRKKITHETVAHLGEYFHAGDLLLINTSGTLPASFRGFIERSGIEIEMRLAAFRGTSIRDLREWSALSFGAGDWRNPTENRGKPPALSFRDRILIGKDLEMEVVAQIGGVDRLFHIEFLSSDLIPAIYQFGQAIQYSYHSESLKEWDIQTLFSHSPISVEPPSAAFPFTWDLLLALMKKGVRIETVLHSAGLSSTGDSELDALLPLEEYYEVSEKTLQAIEETHTRQRKVIALGTSVTRAVESAVQSGKHQGLTNLKLGPASSIQVIDTLITGMHEAGSSHWELMKAFCDDPTLSQVISEAEKFHYRSHEYGDLTMIDREGNFG